MIITIDLLQWIGCATGGAGAFLLATRTRYSGVGFVLFLLSNFFWIAFGLRTGANGLVANNALFTITSVLGIYRWLIRPAAPAPRP